MLFNYMKDICEALDIQYVDYPGWLWAAGHNLAQTCYRYQNADEIYNHRIAYVGNREPISGLGAALQESAYAFTMIRDPRDCLVSMYFSFLGTHPAPASLTPEQIRVWNAQKRKQMEETSLDEYVLQKAPEYKSNLLAILDFSRKAGDCTIIKYEDYILRKHALCELVADTLRNLSEKPLDSSTLNIDALASARDFIPVNERPNQHVRRALPGDHIEKLKPETIGQLNMIFEDTIMEHGYLL